LRVHTTNDNPDWIAASNADVHFSAFSSADRQSGHNDVGR